MRSQRDERAPVSGFERHVAALIWDMDGTLIDSATVVPDAFIATTAALGGTSCTRDEVVALYSLGEPATMLGHLLDRPASRSDVDAYHRELASRADGVRPYLGIQETLVGLQPALPMGVFTGASTRAAEILLSSAGLADHFRIIVGGNQVTAPKPDPGGIELACRLLGLRTVDCAYIGDAPTDLEAARRSGALPLAAGWGHLHQPPADAVAQVIEHPTDLLALQSICDDR
jgi:phosphoglycolate phosphatase-like HAD superfamily hydrolase